MTLTLEQQEKIVRLRAKLTKLNDELNSVMMPDVILTVTKSQEILNIKAEITLFKDHAGMTRDEYVVVVQPLKDQLINLIQQNEDIHQENGNKKQVAQQQYNSDRAIILQQIHNNEVELLNSINVAIPIIKQ